MSSHHGFTLDLTPMEDHVILNWHVVFIPVFASYFTKIPFPQNLPRGGAWGAFDLCSYVQAGMAVPARTVCGAIFMLWCMVIIRSRWFWRHWCGSLGPGWGHAAFTALWVSRVTSACSCNVWFLAQWRPLRHSWSYLSCCSGSGTGSHFLG